METRYAEGPWVVRLGPHAQVLTCGQIIEVIHYGPGDSEASPADAEGGVILLYPHTIDAEEVVREDPLLNLTSICGV